MDTALNKVRKTVFGVWETEPDSSYWMIFDTLEDAAPESKGRTIYRLDAEPLGKYRVVAVLEKVKQRKKKRKAK